MPRPPIKTASFLANLPLFKALAPDELAPIAAGTTEVFVQKGEVVFQRGDPCIGFHLVVYGQVKLAFVSPPGGASFGEALMFMEMPYILMAQALADSLLLHVGRDVVFREIERQPAFARKMLAGLSRRLHGLMHDVEAYSLQSGTQRVIGYLLRQDASHEGESAPYTVTLPTSKAIVASRLNVTPEHLSRILHELVESRLIAVDGRDVHILDVPRLRDYGTR